MSGRRERRPQPEIVANNFRLYAAQRSLGMTVTRGLRNTYLNFHFLGLDRQNAGNFNVNSGDVN